MPRSNSGLPEQLSSFILPGVPQLSAFRSRFSETLSTMGISRQATRGIVECGIMNGYTRLAQFLLRIWTAIVFVTTYLYWRYLPQPHAF